MDAYTASMIVQATLFIIGAEKPGQAPLLPAVIRPRQRLQAV